MATQSAQGFALTLIGAGNMGGALLGGWLANGLSGSAITVVEPSPRENMADLIVALGARLVASAAESSPADVLVLAVKPQILETATAQARGLIGPETVTLSVAAGKSIAAIGKALGAPGSAIVRAMPNTPALVQRGMTVACPNERVTAVQRGRVNLLLQAVGAVEWIDDEGLMDAVTAVSGSGPAYVFLLAECMAQAGIAAGLREPLAMRLARETVSGAGELLARSSDTPAHLRQNVTSPKGTTAAALEVLMGEEGLRELIERAVAAAARRSRELG